MANNKVISDLRNLIQVKDLMTKEVKFYEDLNERERVEFCGKRDIDHLPSRDFKRYMLFDKRDKTFSESDILNEEKIAPSLNIHEFIKLTEPKSRLFFVFENNKMIGIIHFCDLINSLAYVYFYALFNFFERKLRNILKEEDVENEDVLNWLKVKNTPESKEKIVLFKDKQEKYHLPEFQHFELGDLLKFMLYQKLRIDNHEISREIIKNVPKVRNSIMHNKDIVKRQENSDIEKEMLYDWEDYKEFLKVYFWLLEVLEE